MKHSLLFGTLVSRETLAAKMAEHIKIGALGENVGSDYLKGKGFRILSRNVKVKRGEIDIIVRDKNGSLVFVEVKSMNENENIKPEDNLTTKKLSHIQKAAQFYSARHPELIHERSGWRIDLLAITFEQSLDQWNISHYENI